MDKWSISYIPLNDYARSYTQKKQQEKEQKQCQETAARVLTSQTIVWRQWRKREKSTLELVLSTLNSRVSWEENRKIDLRMKMKQLAVCRSNSPGSRIKYILTDLIKSIRRYKVKSSGYEIKYLRMGWKVWVTQVARVHISWI